MKRNPLEWVVLGTSVLAIIVLVGVLVVEGLSPGGPANPTVDLRPDEGYQGGIGWIIPATVHNLGDESAEAVVIEAEATIDGESEVSELEVPFAPAGSTIDVAFAFSGRPEGEVTLRLISFRVP
ncbi:MAG TPA: hypothetical protein VEX62_10020 [Candidatus Limnocylindrales bacterium]|nr:hypothetical protein [Candidatus Limnocylindrales bacterium]